MNVFRLGGVSQITFSNFLLFLVKGLLIAYFFDRKFLENKLIFLKIGLISLSYSIFLNLQYSIRSFSMLNKYFIKTTRIELSAFTDGILISLIIFYICRKMHIKGLTITFWISVLLLCISSTSTAIDVAVTFVTKYSLINPIYRALINILLLSLTLFGIKKVLNPTFMKEVGQNSTVQVSLIGISILSNITLNYFTRDLLYPELLSYHVLTFVTIIIILINMFVLALYKGQENFYTNLNRLELENKTFESQTKQFELVKETQERISEIKHDLKNEHLVLLSLLKSNEVGQATSFLEKTLNSIEDTDKFYTNNTVLNFWLDSKYKEAIEKGIDFKLKILLPEKTTIENEVLAVVVGNLLDNAFAAVLRDTLHKNEVYLVMKLLNRNLLIEVSNHFDVRELENRAMRQKLGYGLKNIQRVVNERGGVYKQWIDEDVFHTSIMFFFV